MVRSGDDKRYLQTITTPTPFFHPLQQLKPTWLYLSLDRLSISPPHLLHFTTIFTVFSRTFFTTSVSLTVFTKGYNIITKSSPTLLWSWTYLPCLQTNVNKPPAWTPQRQPLSLHPLFRDVINPNDGCVQASPITRLRRPSPFGCLVYVCVTALCMHTA